MGKAVAYLRVSTQQQHRSGLGIEAQRAAIARFAEAEELTIIGEFVEAETAPGGKLRAIAVTGPERFFLLPDVPDVPTIADTVKGYAVTSWLGVAGPADLPVPFVARINAELRAMLTKPAVIERLRGLGSETRPTTPEAFKAHVADDVAKWTKVVADAKIPKV
jgi:tripartite-type tricarboxylate transporter receptor subunit TctC